MLSIRRKGFLIPIEPMKSPRSPRASKQENLNDCGVFVLENMLRWVAQATEIILGTISRWIPLDSEESMYDMMFVLVGCL